MVNLADDDANFTIFILCFKYLQRHRDRRHSKNGKRVKEKINLKLKQKTDVDFQYLK